MQCFEGRVRKRNGSLEPAFLVSSQKNIRVRPKSNRRLFDLQSNALPPELRAHVMTFMEAHCLFETRFLVKITHLSLHGSNAQAMQAHPVDTPRFHAVLLIVLNEEQEFVLATIKRERKTSVSSSSPATILPATMTQGNDL